MNFHVNNAIQCILLSSPPHPLPPFSLHHPHPPPPTHTQHGRTPVSYKLNTSQRSYKEWASESFTLFVVYIRKISLLLITTQRLVFKGPGTSKFNQPVLQSSSFLVSPVWVKFQCGKMLSLRTKISCVFLSGTKIKVVLRGSN